MFESESVAPIQRFSSDGEDYHKLLGMQQITKLTSLFESQIRSFCGSVKKRIEKYNLEEERIEL